MGHNDYEDQMQEAPMTEIGRFLPRKDAPSAISSSERQQIRLNHELRPRHGLAGTSFSTA